MVTLKLQSEATLGFCYLSPFQGGKAALQRRVNPPKAGKACAPLAHSNQPEADKSRWGRQQIQGVTRVTLFLFPRSRAFVNQASIPMIIFIRKVIFYCNENLQIEFTLIKISCEPYLDPAGFNPYCKTINIAAHLMESHILSQDLVKGDNVVCFTNYALRKVLSSSKPRTQSGTLEIKYTVYY